MKVHCDHTFELFKVPPGKTISAEHLPAQTHSNTNRVYIFLRTDALASFNFISVRSTEINASNLLMNTSVTCSKFHSTSTAHRHNTWSHDSTSTTTTPHHRLVTAQLRTAGNRNGPLTTLVTLLLRIGVHLRLNGHTDTHILDTDGYVQAKGTNTVNLARIPSTRKTLKHAFPN